MVDILGLTNGIYQAQGTYAIKPKIWESDSKPVLIVCSLIFVRQILSFDTFTLKNEQEGQFSFIHTIYLVKKRERVFYLMRLRSSFVV